MATKRPPPSPPDPPSSTIGQLSSDLSPELQKVLRREMGSKTWGDGERIQSPNELARGLYVIESGGVRFTNVGSDGRETETGRLAPGEWFGHISLLSGLPPPHEAFAIGRTRIWMLPPDRFDALIDEYPELARSLLRHLAINVRQLFTALDGLRSLPARARVARWLLALASRQHGGARVEVDHGSLASQVGVTRVTVGKILRDLAQTGAIQQGYGWIEVIDADALARE